ncbi:DUF748 domain-containing protein [Lutibacter sp. A64]|uniref:DUF748 domain-containing protein n=1 Tax=Lutibacter sp. A64 TaxID=2918526 RepID=UPI001F0605C9|nr:DUF748 domain-containing protein [Lutibacter sp. A64]UMB54916.1 DUF748 domain-containing protein [Lutibacter sp. A64]
MQSKKKLIIGGLVLLILITIFLLLSPAGIKNYVIKNSKSLVGRQIDIDKLNLNYFTGTIKLIDFKMFENDGTTEFIKFDTLILNTEPYKYINNKIVIEQFLLSGLTVNTIQKDSIFNFNDLLEFYKSEPDTLQTKEEDLEPIKYYLNNLELKGANFIYNDKNINQITTIEDFSFFIPFIGWNQTEKTNADLKFSLNEDSTLKTKININPIDGEFDSDLIISNLHLNSFYNYIAPYAEINSFEGQLNSHLKIEGNIYDALKSIVSGNISIQDFEITDTSNKKFITAKEIGTQLQKIDYINNSYTIDSLYINEPYTYFKLDSISNNFSKVFKLNDTTKVEEIATENSTTDTIQETFQKNKLYYAINHFNMTNGLIDFNDNSSSEKFNYLLSSIQINSDSISNDSELITVNSNLVLNEKGKLNTELNVNPSTLKFDSDLNIDNLYLDTFYNYITPFAEINSFKGQVNTEIKIKGNFNDALKSTVSGNVSVNNFEMTDTSNKKFIAAKNIDAQLQNIDYTNNLYKLKSLTINEPYTYFQLDSITNNFFKIFKLDETRNTENVENSQKKAKENELYYAIKKLNVSKGQLDYSDNLTGEKFDYHLSNIQIDTDSIYSNFDLINIYSNMRLNKRGKLNAKLSINPTDFKNAEIAITVERFLLSDINIYSRYYMGHDILEGDFFYNTKTNITDGNLTSENKLLVKNASVSSTAKGLNKLPLKFALFLLKDKNGDVELDVPVRGDLNDPSVNISGIVWTTFKNLILKTVASPVNFLADFIGVEPKELEEIELNYTDTIPSTKNQQQLNKLIDLETKKKGLKIELLHFVDLNLQKEAVALKTIGAQFNAETQKDYIKNDNQFKNYLIAKTAPDTLSVKDAVLKLSANINLDSIVSTNNSKLLKNTKAYLIEKNPFTRIKVLTADPKEPEHLGSKSKFNIKYNLLEDRIKIKKDSL